MKRKLPLIASIIVLVILTVFVCNFNTVKNYVVNTFWDITINELLREEADRQERIKNGEIVPGRDTAFIWENRYVIYHNLDDYALYIEQNGDLEQIIKNIKCYDGSNKKFYVVSDEGYVIIDKNNMCRVCITVSADKFSSDYTTDEKVRYLSSFDEFDEKEQKYFNMLEKKDNK